MKLKTEKNRFYFESSSHELIAEINFTENDNDLIINRTFVNPNYRGQQLAQQLLKELVENAKLNHKKIVPLCSFVQREFEKNTSYQKLQK